MKKCLNICFTCLLMAMLVLPALAAQDTVKVSDTEAAPGDVIYLTVSVTKPMEGSSMGIKYTFDDKVLKVLPGSCSWEVSGMIEDFSAKGNNGVWAAGEVVELQGDVCVLAFTVLPEAKLTQTVVECTLVVENNGKQEYKASATVSAHCDHKYSPWSGYSGELHSRKCELCEKMENQSHQWDAGVEEQRGNKRLQVFTCTVCKDEKELVIGDTVKPTESTKPHNEIRDPNETLKPTESRQEEQHRHQDEDIQSGMIGVPVEPDKGRLEFSPSEPTGHEHTEDSASQEVLPEHPHTHENNPSGKNPGWTAAVILGVLVVFVGGVVWYLKKK